jgi:hypothetical protein
VLLGKVAFEEAISASAVVLAASCADLISTVEDDPDGRTAVALAEVLADPK